MLETAAIDTGLLFSHMAVMISKCNPPPFKGNELVHFEDSFQPALFVKAWNHTEHHSCKSATHLITNNYSHFMKTSACAAEVL